MVLKLANLEFKVNSIVSLLSEKLKYLGSCVQKGVTLKEDLRINYLV
jgi:hypothetical protein